MNDSGTWPSCNRMNDGQFHTYASRLIRISSCKVQNCGIGYCQTGNNRKTCVNLQANHFFIMGQSNYQLFPINSQSTDPLDDADGNVDAYTTSNNRKKNILRWIILAVVLILIIIVIIIIIVIVVHKKKPKEKATILIYNCSENSTGISNRKVLFIIADGIPADVLERAPIPNMKKIQQIGKYKRAYVGGDVGTYSETATISAPGYINLLTGTWGNKHNVYDNKISNPNYNYKNIFRLIKEQQINETIGIFSTWLDNRVKLIGEGLPQAGNITFDFKFDGYELDLKNFPHDSQSLYINHIDQHVINETVKCITNSGPDASWVYLQYTDDMGHAYGDSPQMLDAINILDQQIGQIYEAIQCRINQHKEEWLLVITTDHGRDIHTGQNHGGQSERERTTWIIMNHNETNNYFENFQPSIVDIMPTMMRFLNMKIPLESEREIDGIPLIGPVSLVKPDLNLNGNNLTIKWKTLNKTGNVKIWLSTTNLFKDGSIDNYTLIGNVSIENEIATFNIEKYVSNFYKIILDGEYNMVNKWISRK
ncbi:unnamed protein product [Adineta steineri]|uniref:Uncharacterized protein n=1 Tax=Adineta steineri TaxID=433720 RepID=A0A819NVU3_9BILA|nr:unnamed protein product [Adineta steineri]CAF3999112.1 unnamed protein product [Adineta steineri]